MVATIGSFGLIIGYGIASVWAFFLVAKKLVQTMRIMRERRIKWPQWSRIRVCMFIAPVVALFIAGYYFLGYQLWALNLFVSILALSSLGLSRALILLIWVKLFRKGGTSAADSADAPEAGGHDG